MEKTKKWKKENVFMILCILMVMIFHTTSHVWAVDIIDDDITEPILGPVSAYGEVNVYADITYGLLAKPDSTVNIYAGAIGDGTNWGISVSSDSPTPVVTVFGTAFEVSSIPLNPGPWTPGNAVLTVTYENNTVVDLLFSSDVPIILADPGGPTPNNPPVAEAGPDLTVFPKYITSTIIEGTASDPVEGDPLKYRWLEGSVELKSLADVGPNGEAPLDLGTLLPQYLGVGTHILTLEVNDGTETVSDDMVLILPEISIDIKPGSYPNSVNINGHGVIPVAILGGEGLDVTDIDIATLSFAGLALRVKGNGAPQCSIQDVSGDFTNPEGAPDGYPDLVCQFVDDPEHWLAGDTIAELTGCLLNGIQFAGSDEITIVP